MTNHLDCLLEKGLCCKKDEATKIPRVAQRDGPSCQALLGSANSLIMRVEDLDKAMIHSLK
jgi:hypothetical protein